MLRLLQTILVALVVATVWHNELTWLVGDNLLTEAYLLVQVVGSNDVE